MAFARQKIQEVVIIKQLANSENITHAANRLKENIAATNARKTSPLIHNLKLKKELQILKMKKRKGATYLL